MTRPMTTPTLADVIASLEPQDLTFTLDAPPSWSQGRTLYGGMTAALAWAAAGRAFPDLPPLRSVQAAFVGPAAGRLAFAPTNPLLSHRISATRNTLLPTRWPYATWPPSRCPPSST